jgi:hypothetical protein
VKDLLLRGLVVSFHRLLVGRVQVESSHVITVDWIELRDGAANIETGEKINTVHNKYMNVCSANVCF